MPALSNPRHERFAQHLAKGHSASEAYEKAGYKPNRQAASRLLSKVDVQGRVQELQDVGAQRAEMTVEGHLDKLQELRDKALEAGQHSAAITAEQLRGKVSGYYVERHEVDQHTTVSDEPLEASEDEWAESFGDDARIH
jgi:phage terminase small subunit